MVRVVKHMTTYRHWKEIRRLPKSKIVGRPRLSFDILQEVALHCDVETAKNLGFICREMNKRMNAKVLQPLKQHDQVYSQALCLTICKEKGVDELYLEMADENTIVAPLNRFMRYIWYIPCILLEISISKDDISTVWKQLYVHFKNVCGDVGITVVSADIFSSEDISPMTDMVLRVLRPMCKIRLITVGWNDINFFHMDKDHSFDENDGNWVSVEFPSSSEFPAELLISVIESAPFSELCEIAVLYDFDSVQPAIAAFASTQRPVPEGLFKKLSEKDFAFELVSSGAKLHITDRIDLRQHDHDGSPDLDNYENYDVVEMFELDDYIDDEIYGPPREVVNDL